MGRPAVLKIDILADAKGVGRGVADADSALGKLGKGARMAGLAIGAGLAAGAAAVGAFAVSAVGEASHVEQAMGGLEAVFGKNARTVKRWSDQAATSVGLSKAQYADLAAVLGSQLTGMGMTLDAATARTGDLVKRGADLAATFGGTTADAVSALGSVLKGEFDPIERYGISIKQSDINARLAAQGQEHLTGAALKTATAQAALALITEHSASSHGQFAAQSDTLAEKQQVLAAKFDNLKARIGAELIPVVSALAGFLSEKVGPAVSKLADQLAAALGPALAKVGAFVDGTVLPAARRLAVFFSTSVQPVLTTVAHVIGTLLLPLLLNIGHFIYGTVLPAVLKLAGPVLGAFRSALQTIGQHLEAHREQLATVGRFLQTTAGLVLKLAGPIGSVLGFALRTLGTILGGVIDTFATLVGWLDKAWHAVSKLGGPLKAVGGALSHLHFGGVELAGPAAGLIGAGPSYAPGPALTTAALGDPGGVSLLGAAPAIGGTTVVVDRRTIDARVFVDGALDPVSVARQIEQLLNDQAVRLARVSAFGTS